MNWGHAGTGALLGGLRAACATFPDRRQWRPEKLAMADAGMAAFSLFFMQRESFLSHRRRMDQGRNAWNCRMLFGIERIPATATFATCWTPRRGKGCSRASIRL